MGGEGDCVCVCECVRERGYHMYQCNALHKLPNTKHNITKYNTTQYNTTHYNIFPSFSPPDTVRVVRATL